MRRLNLRSHSLDKLRSDKSLRPRGGPCVPPLVIYVQLYRYDRTAGGGSAVVVLLVHPDLP
jgi:hypothetical protein